MIRCLSQFVSLRGITLFLTAILAAGFSTHTRIRDYSSPMAVWGEYCRLSGMMFLLSSTMASQSLRCTRSFETPNNASSKPSTPSPYPPVPASAISAC